MSSATEFEFSLQAVEPRPRLELEAYEVPPPQEGQVSNPFYFEDTQVVLQASHDIASYPYIH
jgi:hypothetical protein